MQVSKTFQSDLKRDIVAVFNERRKELDWADSALPDEAGRDSALCEVEAALAEYVSQVICPEKVTAAGCYDGLVKLYTHKISLCIQVSVEIL